VPTGLFNADRACDSEFEILSGLAFRGRSYSAASIPTHDEPEVILTAKKTPGASPALVTFSAGAEKLSERFGIPRAE
jgi:hypothetical protein